MIFACRQMNGWESRKSIDMEHFYLYYVHIRKVGLFVEKFLDLGNSKAPHRQEQARNHTSYETQSGSFEIDLGPRGGGKVWQCIPV